MSLPRRRDAQRSQGPSKTNLRRGLERVEALPTLPEVITQVLSLVDDPGVSAQRVAEVVGRDQSIVSAILRLVNSPYYGLRGRITSIQQAVVLLGLRTVRNMALSSVLVKAFSNPSKDDRFNRRLLWRHTVACAVGARWLASDRGRINGDEAFLAGLLHDMGLVIMDQYFHPDFCMVLDAVTGSTLGLLEAETVYYGLDHAAVGAILGRRWNFPPAVCDAIGCHHRPAKAERAPELAALVHLAHFLPDCSRETQLPQVWEGLPMDEEALDLAGISPDLFAVKQETFGEEWAEAEAFIGLLS